MTASSRMPREQGGAPCAEIGEREVGRDPDAESSSLCVPWGPCGWLCLLGGKGVFGAGKEMGTQGLRRSNKTVPINTGAELAAL